MMNTCKILKSASWCGNKLRPFDSLKASNTLRRIQTYILSETKHLGPGSECPPRKQGVLRLYSMKMCPFAQRTRLVLSAKAIPHEVVNINLKTKPPWYLSLHAPGKVPALEQDGTLVGESLVTAELLEELYPQPALHSGDPWRRAADRCMVEMFNPVITTLYQMYAHSDDPEKIEELRGKFSQNIEPLSAELASRSSAFFHGERPGMLDLMVWPWLERLPAFAAVCGSPPLLPEGGAADPGAALSGWVTRMQRDPHVEPCISSVEDHVNYMVTHKEGIVATQRRNALKSSVDTAD